MLINRKTHGYSINKKFIIGRGFVDSLSSIFNSNKSSVVPGIKEIGSYISTNKDQLFKPVMGAFGTLGAKALTEGVPALINKIASRNKNQILNVPLSEIDHKIIDDPKYKEILENIMAPPPQTVPVPVPNIIGSRIKIRRGAGIKKF